MFGARRAETAKTGGESGLTALKYGRILAWTRSPEGPVAARRRGRCGGGGADVLCNTYPRNSNLQERAGRITPERYKLRAQRNDVVARYALVDT